MEIIPAKKSQRKKISKMAINSILSIKTDKYSNKQLQSWVNKNTHVEKWFKDRKVYVALDKKNIVASIGIKQNKISRFFIDKSYQGKGLGKKMMSFAEGKIKKKYQTSTLDSVLSAISFYKKLGYHEKEKLMRNFDGVMFPEIRMEKKLW